MNQNHGQELQKQKEIEKQSAAREDTNLMMFEKVVRSYSNCK
jgi:hypothetical protein